MRALKLLGPGSAVVVDDDPPEPGPGEAVVEVHRVGVCGTDVELYTGELIYFDQGEARYPLRPGHEWAGRVVELGDAVDASWMGARVTGDTMLPCGRCELCVRGRGHTCADRFEIGIRRGRPGALAERLAVPVSCLHRLPDGVDDTAGAMVEPGGNAWRAARATCAGAGETVLVFGPGTIGLLTAAFAAMRGAQVHMIGLDRSRQPLAQRMGAASFWTTDEMPPMKFDAVVDCTGDGSVPAAAVGCVLPGGRLVYIGVSGSASLLDTRQLVVNDITAVGVLSGSPGLAATIEAYASGRVAPEALVGETVGLAEAVDVLAGKRRPPTGTKIHVDPRY